jgi:hypothetical protein
LANVLCLALAFVVATEFYLSAAAGPAPLTWIVAAQAALRDWIPWMLLSPVVVLLAGVFRFDAKQRLRNLLAHLAACLAVGIAVEGLISLAIRLPQGAGVALSFNGLPGMGLRMNRAGNRRGGPMSAPVASVSNSGPRPATEAVPLPHDRTPAGALLLGFDNPTNGQWVLTSNGVSTMAVAGSAGMRPPPLFAGGGPMPPPFRSGWSGLLHRALFRFQFAAPIYWWIVCGCWALDHFKESRDRERRALELEARLTQAQLQALKMQLQPHFLFNALNAIATLVHENPNAAEDMIGALSHLLRLSLDVSSENEVRLEKELEFLDRYLEIQETRFGDRLQVRWEVEPSVRSAAVPPFLLQPLVENAIRHGIETRERGGLVTIRGQRLADTLRLEVCDDGGGIGDRGWPGIGQGIGLSNTKARLQALYGSRHQFRLTANRPSGVCACIEIPFHTIEPRNDNNHDDSLAHSR